MYGPVAVIATPSVAQPSFALLGDSVINGIGGDITGTDVGFNPSIKATVHGWAERAIGYTRGGFVQLGCNGESSILWSVNQRLRNAIAQLSCTWAWYQMGANDGGNTLLQMQTYTMDVVRKYHAMGKKIAIGTIVPRTTSSDGWTTLVNQTSAWPAAVRTAYNDWVRAGSSGADTFIECATPVESSFNSGLWKITGLTADGVHPNAAGSAAIAATINMSRFT
jgi:lysophospholipase L1-like esterase